jgi:hypothetical protein
MPELIIAISITAMFSGLIMVFVFNAWRSLSTVQVSLDTFGVRLDADDTLRTRLSSSSGLIIQNSLADSHTNNPDPAIPSNLYWVPMHAVPGNITVGASGTTTPLIYFRSPSIDTSGNIVMNGTQPYEDEYVLYLDGSTRKMMLRTIANSSATNNKALTSCPLASASSSCPADRTIADHLDSVDIRYFSRSGNLIDWHSIYDPDIDDYAGPDFPTVEAVEFNLHLSENAAVNNSVNAVNQTVIRIALRNA